MLEDANVCEWMPRYSEILAIVKALGIGGVDMSLKDKSAEIPQTFELLNAVRLAAKRGQGSGPVIE